MKQKNTNGFIYMCIYVQPKGETNANKRKAKAKNKNKQNGKPIPIFSATQFTLEANLNSVNA